MFVALRVASDEDEGEAEDSGPDERKVRRHRREFASFSDKWEIIGFANFSEAKCFQDPTGHELHLLEQMRNQRHRGGFSKYEFPIAAIVSLSGLFVDRVQVTLPSRKFATAVLPVGVREAIADSTVCSMGTTLTHMVGPSCLTWLVWKCNDMNIWLSQLMVSQSQFTWPLYPIDAKGLGLKVPHQALPFSTMHTKVDTDSESEASDTWEEHGKSKQKRFEAPTLLKFLKFHAMLKPGTNIRSALALAASLLGDDPTFVENASVVDIPAKNTLRRAQVKVDLSLMLWSRHLWGHGYQATTCLLADSSEQNHYDYFCQRSDSIEIPPNLKDDERAQLDVRLHFRRSILPLAVVGYGETDLPHKVRAMLHVARLMTGSISALDAWRLSIRGMCTDQGAERGLCDIPFIADPSHVSQVLSDYQEKKIPMLCSEPSTFFFPKAVLITGPLHIVWNAFETAVKQSPSWPNYKETLAAILHLLGHQGLRTRFLETCFDRAEPGERKYFYNWRYNVVDWKWEYMEEVFVRLSSCISTFLLRFDEEKIKAPVDKETSADTIAPGCLAKIKLAQSAHLVFSARTETLKIFAQAVGQSSRWFGGCSCHDHIWRNNLLSEREKKRLFEKETGGKVSECVWRGRRGSELARGHWRQMVSNVRRATSSELHIRLCSLDPQERGQLAAEFDRMKVLWCEEMSAKFTYWDAFPHRLFGLWPADSQSRRRAQAALEMWEQLPADEKTTKCHRVTYRLLHPASKSRFRPLIDKLAQTGIMDPALQNELQEVNMVATYEQRVEEIHARIFQLNHSVGASLKPPSTSARLRWGEHLRCLSDWQCHIFVVQNWTRRHARELLAFCMDNAQFVRHAPQVDILYAVYHCLPAQLFKNVNEDKLMHNEFQLALQPPPPTRSAPIRLFLEFCRDLFAPGTVVSMPKELLQVAQAEVAPLLDGDLMLVPYVDGPGAFDENSLVQEALAVVASDVENPMVLRMGRNLKDHRFFRVVRKNSASRFLLSSDGNANCRVGLVELELAGREGGAGLFPQATAGILNFDVLKTIKGVGTKAFFESLFIWKESQHALLNLQLPSAGTVPARMRTLPRCAGTSDLAPSTNVAMLSQGWSEVVATIIDLQESSSGVSYFDPVAEVLRSEDGTRVMTVPQKTLDDLVAFGVLMPGSTEFGDPTFKVNPHALQWCAAAGLEQGTRDFAGHIDPRIPHKHSKLSLMMRLLAQGWTPKEQGKVGDYYAEGLDKHFELALTRSKLYFATLVVVDTVLHILALEEEVLPVVYHGMTESYYKLLLRMKGSADARALLALLDKAKDVKQLPDRDFAELLPAAEADTWRDKDEGDDGVPEPLPALLDLPKKPTEELDIAKAHRMAVQVLRAVPARMVDFRSSWCCDDGGLKIQIHFDNCSHSSGKQRAYVACPAKWHRACFKYSIVENFASDTHVAAWLTAWARHAAEQTPETFSKEQHKGFAPIDATWQALVPHMRENDRP